MKLRDCFLEAVNAESTHEWVLVSHNHKISPLDALAECLADKIMSDRCQACPDHYKAWKKRISDGTQLPPTSYEILSKGFIKPAFGLPNSPSQLPADHLQGLVSQYIWYFLILESDAEKIERVEPPGFAATDHGADGMVIHRLIDGRLMFRLWEIKKCTGTSPVSSTVNTAYNQLKERAYEYLARYTAIGQELPDKELSEFYGRLPDLWAARSSEAAAGIAVTLNFDNIPATCFTTFGDQFPEFLDPKRLRGMLTALQDFPSFSERVQEAIWKGL